ncbi:MAG TPA: tetratricopeptide repeat protein [Myxococcaceae bacterium]|nr:tetratricopeptide repeat protein [Myxococcaceae bacterium]
MFVAVGVVLLAAGGAYLAGGMGSGSSAEAEGGFDYGRKAVLVAKLKGELAKEPCNRTKVVEYLQTLLSAEDWRGTIRDADDFIARCGKFPQLRSFTWSAHTRLSEFDLAVRDATELIDSAPRNAGYWVWRAMAHESRGALDEALKDFEQAFSLQPDKFQIANQLASAYERQKQPCEAYDVLLEHVRMNPGIAGQPDMEARLLNLLDQGKCTGKQRKRKAP